MSGYAILVSGAVSQPRAVHLEVDEDVLHLSGAGGFEDRVAWWRLFRTNREGSTHRFGRIDRRGWELRVTAGADQALLAHVKSSRFGRFGRPLRLLGSIKVWAGVVAFAMMLSESIPARQIAPILPRAAQERLVSGYIGSNARIRCNHPGGEAAIRTLMMRLDPTLGRSVEVVGIKVGGFMMSAIPGNKIMLHPGAVTEVEAEAVAALLAHELAHLRNGDATAAMIRHEGNLGTLFALIEGEDRRDAFLTFSGQEEERADREAIAMMRRAKIAIAPAAEMFEAMRIASVRGEGFAFEQREFHFGIANRARFWQVAAIGDPPGMEPPLSRDQADALYNFCWAGPLPPSKARRPAPPRPAQ